VWSAALGKILTLDNLRKRNFVLVNRCGMCKKEEETIDHLLLHCESAQFLWNAFFSRFGLAWVMPQRVVDLLHCWWSGGGGGASTQCRGLENGTTLYHVVPLVRERMGDFSRTLKEARNIFYISFLLLFSRGWRLDWPLL
jgi:hypothetical protein